MEYISMDKRFKISKILNRMFIFLLLFASLASDASAFGFDSANSCSPNGKMSRRGRAQMLASIPCDLTHQAYCNLPGHAYPWHAVRRFVHENQGLMKRMYGDVRHISILRDEIQNNEIDIEDVEVAAERYSRDGGQRRASKFMHQRDDVAVGGASNNNKNDHNSEGVLMDPHFRPVSSATSTTTTTAATPLSPEAAGELSTPATTQSSRGQSVESSSSAGGSRRRGPNASHLRRRTTTSPPTTTTSAGEPLDDDDGEGGHGDGDGELEAEVAAPQLDFAEEERVDFAPVDGAIDDSNLASNSVYELVAPTSPQTLTHGDNIELIESPQLGGLHNLSVVVSTISTTLRKVTVARVPEATATTTTAGTAPMQTQSQILAQRKQPSRRRPSHEPQRLHSATASKEGSPTAATSTKDPSGVAAPSSAPSPSSSASTAPVRGSPMALKTAVNKIKFNQNSANNSPTEPTRSEAAAAAFLPSTLPSSSAAEALAPLSSPSSSPLPIRPNAALLSGERLQKRPTVSSTATTSSSTTTTTTTTTPSSAPAASAATKPVLRDGQLFQDTLKQEPSPVANMRGINACPVKEEVVAPFWANNTRGEVLALLNLYPFEQYVHWEKCTHEHKQMFCRDGCRCEQQFRLHRLLAYDPHNECRGIFSDWFRFPSCCICKCYNIPTDFRATSRSPRSESSVDGGAGQYQHPIEQAEQEVKRAIYAHATEDWYRPKDEFVESAYN